jgi:hypothetical protein
MASAPPDEPPSEERAALWAKWTPGERLAYGVGYRDRGAEVSCGCSGPDDWHCPGEDSQHWADTDGITCGHCGTTGVRF